MAKGDRCLPRGSDPCVGITFSFSFICQHHRVAVLLRIFSSLLLQTVDYALRVSDNVTLCINWYCCTPNNDKGFLPTPILI